MNSWIACHGADFVIIWTTKLEKDKDSAILRKRVLTVGDVGDGTGSHLYWLNLCWWFSSIAESLIPSLAAVTSVIKDTKNIQSRDYVIWM